LTTTELLGASEQTAYGNTQVEISSYGRELFVLSDLHLAAGFNHNSNYDGTENFFADAAFSRFIGHLNTTSAGRTSILIINGDFVDFLRIRNIPGTIDDFTIWQSELKAVGINKTTEELNRCVTKKEVDFGLKTDDYKSIWKLWVCANGHPKVFESLAAWILNGNDLIIVKGNHDLEWYWKAVRDYLRLILAKDLAALKKSSITETLSTVISQVTFVDDRLLIDGKIYIEHGHRYENFTAVDGHAVLENGTELNLPFGSFFNRYLINRIELAYPHIDDVRPRQKILPLLLQERFPLAVKLLFYYIPFAFRVIPKKKYAYALRYLFQFLLIIGLPILITGAAIYNGLPAHAAHSATGLLQSGFTSLKNLAFLSLSYFVGRILSMLRLTAPNSLYINASAVFEKFADVQFVTFGHTHNPEQINYKDEGKRYYNTGTWMPVFETDAGEVRGDKVYTFLHLSYPQQSKVSPILMRWNDDALRIEPLLLIDRK
jgi:UDP-2,3-diacylglucosamine pyrophosphatase LpxH